MCDLKSGERLNFYRMSLLILDVGTYTLQSLFKKEYSATGDLQTFLNSKNGTLRKLYKSKVINQAVKELLQPSNGAKPVLKKFDISLVITLLTNLCPIAQPGTGWNKPPAANDTSTGADILWLRIARNELFAHRSESSMADAIFHNEWNKIVNSISRLSNQLEKKKQNQIQDEIADIEKAHINWEREKEINGQLFHKKLCDIHKKLEELCPDRLEVVSCDEAEDAMDAEIPTGPDGILCVLMEYPKLKLDLPRDVGETIAQHLYKAKLINRDEYDKIKDSSCARRVCIDRLLKLVIQGKSERLECFFNGLKMECPCLAIALSRREVTEEDRIKFQQVKDIIVIDGICTITVNHGIDELDISFFENHFCDSPEVIDGINDELLSQFLISIWDHSRVTYCQSLHDKIRILFGTMQLHQLQVESMLQTMLQADLFERWKNFRNSKLHWKVLNTCLPIFVRDLNFERVFAHICQRNLLENYSCQDISKQTTKSNKTRMLLRCFQQKDRSVYEQFKECLVLSQQSQLKNVLETEEAKLSHGTTRTEEKSSITADQSSWRALLQWIHIAVMPLLAPFARKFRMRFISAEDGSIILKFEPLEEFSIELLDQSEVQHYLENLLWRWCRDSKIKVEGPVYVTVYILSPGEEGREEDIHFHLDFEAFCAQKELKAHLESHERKLLVEELNPSRLHRWMFDQPDIETENKKKVEDIVSQRGLSRREKMELLLDIIIRLENSRGILEKFCKENDKYVYEKVFKKSVQMPSPGKPEMDSKASLSYQKGRGQQKLFSVWINVDGDKEIDKGETMQVPEEENIKKGSLDDDKEKKMGDYVEEDGKHFSEPHGSQPGQFVLSEVHSLEEIQEKYTEDAEQPKHSSRPTSCMDLNKSADLATPDLKHLSPKQLWEGDIEPAKSLVVKVVNSRVSQENKASKTSILVAAIDIGSSFSGWAFSFNHDYVRDPTMIHARQWQVGHLLSMKAPTTVLIKPDGRTFDSFGYEAETKYSELASGGNDEHKRWYYFHHFKMLLHGKMGLNLNVDLVDETLKPLPAKTVFSLVIRYLKNDMLKYIKERISSGYITDDDITWVLTVPAIWTDAAKQFMREAAVEAGIKTENLKIALEPETASIFCSLLPVQRMVEGGGMTSFMPGSTYMVLDAGGEIIDITVHEVMSDGRLREIYKPSGGAWGGTRVDEAYKQLLIRLVGNPVFMRFQLEMKDDYLDMFRDFEHKKRYIAPDNNNRVAIQIPLSLMEIFKDESGEDLCTAIKQTRYANEMFLKQDRLYINAPVMKSLFSEAIQSIVSHVKELMKESAVHSISSILMVGGFSESKMLQNAIRSNFPNIKVVIPHDAGLVVLKGAVVFGHSPSSVAQRKCKYTYGVSINVPFDNKKHDINKRVEYDGVPRCKDIFATHVEIDQMVALNESTKELPYLPSTEAQSNISFRVYASKQKSPMYVTDEGCIMIGYVIVDNIDKSVPKNQRTAFFSLMFGDTELEVTAWEERTGKSVKAILNFL